MKTKIIRKIIKAEAWANVAGNWLRSFAVVILELLAGWAVFGLFPFRYPTVDEVVSASGDFARTIKLFLPSQITPKLIALGAVVLLLLLLVSSPFEIGRCRFFLKVSRGERPKITEAFVPFMSLKTVFSSMGLQIMTIFLSVLWTAVIMIVPFTVMMAAFFIESRFVLDVSVLLFMVAGYFAILVVSRYNFAKYILADNEDTGAIKALGECIRLMRTRSSECIKLRFSYVIYDILFSMSIGPFLFIYRIIFSTVYGKYLDYLRGDRTFTFEAVPPEM